MTINYTIQAKPTVYRGQTFRSRLEARWAAPPTIVPTRDELERLADRVARLSVSHRDPEAFWVNKSEIAEKLRAMARRVEGRA